MNDYTNNPFSPQSLASDLCEVHRIYAGFFAALHEEDWEKPAKRGPQEWNLHETVAHLCALTGAGLESIEHTLRGEIYTFAGLEDRYQFKAYNRRGIDEHLSLPVKDLSAKFLGILDRAAYIAGQLDEQQAQIAAEMPVDNRPVKIVEALGIMMFHAGLHHSAQVAEPAGLPPLWVQLSPEVRHRVVGRVLRALSLLYRQDLGGDLQAVFAFRIDGPGGGSWYVQVSPEAAGSVEGWADRPSLTIHLLSTDVFCRMFTGRINLPIALLTGQMKMRGDLRLFPRMGSLFSVGAKK
jgi:hypothetical protein